MQGKRDYEGSSGGDSSKRQRTHAGPSKVLHVRGIPPGTPESEITALCSPFGAVVKVLMLPTKNQAFVEMHSAEAAENVLAQYSMGTSLRGGNVYMQYSSRQEVSVDPSRAMSAPSGGQYGGGDAPANHICIVTIQNMRMPVTLENIHEVFKRFGEVKKIILFTKDGAFKALVQMNSTEQAVIAKHNLDGKDLFQGCCTLRIGFSTLTDLKVKDNGPRSRDFSRSYGGLGGSLQHSMLAGGFGMLDGGMGGMGGLAMGGMGAMGGLGGEFEDTGRSYGGHAPGAVLLISNLPEGFTPQNVFILCGVYGDVDRVKILYNNRDRAMVQFQQPAHAQSARVHLHGLQLQGKDLKVNTSKHTEVSLPRGDQEADLTMDFSKSPLHRYKRGMVKNVHAPSQVLHISNLADGATEEELRALFRAESSGDVRVHFFSNNRKMAYVAMASLEEAVMALIKLHNHKLNGRYLRVSFSAKAPESITNSDENPGSDKGTAVM